jgi:plasmid stability protein
MPKPHQALIILPKELHTEARIKALREGKTLSAVVRELLAKWLKEESKEEVPKLEIPRKPGKRK